MLEKVAAEKHASTAKMEAVPGFYRIYSSVFLRAYLKTVKHSAALDTSIRQKISASVLANRFRASLAK